MEIWQTIKTTSYDIFEIIKAIARKNADNNQNINESYYDLSKSILIIISLFIILTYFILMLFNGYKGTSQMMYNIFNIDDYRYIDVLNIDLESNINKIYIPGLIMNILGLLVLFAFLYYWTKYRNFK